MRAPYPRRYATTRRARLSECDPSGRARLDAVACWLQDAASDDVRDAGLTDADGVWIVRRQRIEVQGWPRLGEDLDVVTWGSGASATAAERRTRITGAQAAVEAVALWVALDAAGGRPMRLSGRFWDVYGTSVGECKVAVRFTHPDSPAHGPRVPWVARKADLDRVGHVNNAAYLEVVEELTWGAPPAAVEVEYRAGLGPGDAPELVVADAAVWFVAGDRVAASATWSAGDPADVVSP